MQYKWSFPQFIVNPVSDGLPNVVTAINWVCSGTDGFMSSSRSGTVQLGAPNPAQFTPYGDITQDMAYRWVAESISMNGVQDQIADQIRQLSKPTMLTQKPPF